MKVLVLNWKDKKNHLAGGAEIVTEELLKRLVRNGHQATLLTSKFEGCQNKEIVDGYEIIRVGGKWTVYWQAYKYYEKYLKGKFDLVIDEINTIPFFTKFYTKEKNILFIHQLCREIWFYEIFFPLNLIGYLIEPVYLWLLRDRKVIAVSESTKIDLMRFGFKAKNIQIISEGIEIEPVKDLNAVTKFEHPTILALGAIKAMKRTHHIIRAFEVTKEKIKTLRLVIAGAVEGKYGEKVLKMAKESKYQDSIEYLGKVDIGKKIEIMQKCHLILVTSVKEGWGLIVTEANSQGTPAIVYNVDGLRDSVKNNETGLICRQNTPENLAENTIALLLNNQEKYQKLRFNAWQWSKEINFEKSYNDFIKNLS